MRFATLLVPGARLSRSSGTSRPKRTNRRDEPHSPGSRARAGTAPRERPHARGLPRSLAFKARAFAAWVARAVVDMSRDGQPDLVWHHQQTGDVYVWFLSGTSVSWGSYLSPAGYPDTQWKVARIADVDGSGQPDILWRREATGELYVWLLDGVVASGGGYLTPRSLSDGRWQIVPR